MNFVFSTISILSILLISGGADIKFPVQSNIPPAPIKSPPIFFYISGPICLDRSSIPDDEIHWLYMPEKPIELATYEDYGYLSGQLIQSGAIDASGCPLNGLWPSGYANPCGLEKTRDASIYLQNVYDDEILDAGKELGVPPIMIKQLMRYESQFWPGQMGKYHFGLGHLTYFGALTSIAWSPQLYSDMAALVTPTTAPPPNELLANELLSNLNASCQTCPLKVNVPKAETSIYKIAEVLLAYCKQTSQVIYNATKKNAGEVVDYSTVWKLTLLNYNVGPSCVYTAIGASYAPNNDPDYRISWEAVAENTEDKYCRRGINYVNVITEPYYDFK